jgi:hypothetical protein
MSEAQLKPGDRIKVTLEAQQWQIVLNVLGDAPWKFAAPLIEAIRGQCMTHERHEIDGIVATSGEPRDA